ncbi:hypothetical protein Vadar_005084 [Vaccinium darrowii]|uniref:Uncharacterized protein n=1 Tax=Vaccinium darrowii TaxID=229202 RepID=A0ACB7YKH0_9ERIC|nr:hypothetical protein Vadar_005084 [Vaccinium darrowii]
MFIRSLAWGNTPPCLLLLLLFSVTCHGNQNQQFVNSCGNIHNISAPFHLQGDPSHTSNDEYYTLSCDSNNRTVLNLISGKYYVQAINYTGQLIRLVDVGIQTNNICSSFPLSSLTTNQIFAFGVGQLGPFAVELTASVAVFLSCENPIQSPIYISRTGYCNTGEDSARKWVLFICCARRGYSFGCCRFVPCGGSMRLFIAVEGIEFDVVGCE